MLLAYLCSQLTFGENWLKKAALLAVPQQDCLHVQEAFSSVPGEPVGEASRGVVLGRAASILTRWLLGHHGNRLPHPESVFPAETSR